MSKCSSQWREEGKIEASAAEKAGRLELAKEVEPDREAENQRTLVAEFQDRLSQGLPGLTIVSA